MKTDPRRQDSTADSAAGPAKNGNRRRNRPEHPALRPIRLLADLFMPRLCPVCGRELRGFEQHICLPCRAGLPLTYFWHTRDNPAEILLREHAPVERAYCLFFYINGYRQLIRAVKYDACLPLGRYLGRMLGCRIREDPGFSPPDAIVPVPLHPLKTWKRGFNQSELIARSIASVTGGRVDTRRLSRSRFTVTQTHESRDARLRNVQHAFSARPAHRRLPPLSGRHVLLVDDVLTTGATLGACCSLLVRTYGCRVSIASLAFVE